MPSRRFPAYLLAQCIGVLLVAAALVTYPSVMMWLIVWVTGER